MNATDGYNMAIGILFTSMFILLTIDIHMGFKVKDVYTITSYYVFDIVKLVLSSTLVFLCLLQGQLFTLITGALYAVVIIPLILLAMYVRYKAIRSTSK